MMGVFVEAISKMKDSMFKFMENKEPGVYSTVKFEVPVEDLLRLYDEAVKFEREKLELIDVLRIELTKAKHEIERLSKGNASHFRAVCEANVREIDLRSALELIKNTTVCTWPNQEQQINHTHEVAREALKK